MSYPADDIERIKELADQGLSGCAISRYVGISRTVINQILGRQAQKYNVLADNRLSTRQRVKLINQLGAS